MNLTFERGIEQQKKIVIGFFLKKNILISTDFLEDYNNLNMENLYNLITDKIVSKDFLMLNKDIKEVLGKIDKIDLNWFELERSKVLLEKKKDDKIYKKFIEYFHSELKKSDKIVWEKKKNNGMGEVKVLFSYKDKTMGGKQKRVISDFISYFNIRFKSIEKLLQGRQELKNLTLINKIINKKDKGQISFIAMISDKQITKKKNIILTLEDKTGTIKAVIMQNSKIYEMAKDLVLDDIIGINGVNYNDIIIVQSIVFPDIPGKELKKANSDVYAIFISDLHIGSIEFLNENFDRFIKWLNLEIGEDEHKKIAEKVKYIFIIGDLVDGVGIYPGQESGQNISDIYAQYDECAKLLDKIPKDKYIIISPGNHDANRLAEPQLELYKDISKKLWELENVIMVSNPAYVNIHSSENFTGFDVLIYHGYSFDYYVANVDSIRQNGKYDRADLILKFLLKRRHLAPTYSSSLCIPDKEKDSMVISIVPDIFCTGHIHKSYISNYKHITLVSSSCWQSKTDYEERVGHNPEPCRVPIINLKTREAKILKF